MVKLKINDVICTSTFYRTMLYAERGCATVCPSVHLSVRLSDCDLCALILFQTLALYKSFTYLLTYVQVPWSHRLEYFKNNFTAD